MFTVRGRVIEVKPRRGGSYGVTLGPAPDLFWYVVPTPPPKLGSDLTLLVERVVAVKTIGKARLTVLEGVRLHPDVAAPESPIGRVVPPVWFRRIRHVMARPLFHYQEEGAAWLANRLCIGIGSILGDEQGTGKAQPVYEPVLTPSGWKPIGDILVGDYVIGMDGHPTRVVGVYPQGVKRVFKITLSDGSFTRSCAEHLWRVQTNKQRRPRFRGQTTVMSLQQILDDGLFEEWKSGPAAKFYIPLPCAVSYAHKQFRVHPYVLGAFLANGSIGFRSLDHSGSEEQRRLATSMEPRLIFGSTERCTARVLSNGGFKGELIRAFQSMGLAGTESHAKFIPDEYMFGSAPQRMDLLRGLMDNDGTVDRGGCIEYNTSSRKLAEQVLDLVRSLGGVANIRTRVPTFSYLGEKKSGRTDYRVRLSTTFNPFLVERKASRVVPRTKYLPGRSIASVELDGDAECVCIAVDSADRMYITRDYTPTHNTSQTVAAICATQAFPAVVVAPKSLLRNWAREWSYSHYEPRVEILRTKHGPVPDADVYVLSYGTLKEREADIGAIRPATIVFDEAHNLKEPKPAKFHRAAVATRLSHYVRRPILLTGTPVLNRTQEIWRLLHICDPIFWRDYEDFQARYCRAPTNADLASTNHHERRVVTSSGRVEHLDELRTFAEPYILRRLKSDVLKDLPPKTRRSLLVELSEHDLEHYKAAEKDLVAWLRAQGYELQASRAKRAEAIVRLGHLRRLAGEAKLRHALPEYLKHRFAEDQSPLIVFGYFRATCAGIERITTDMGLRVVSIRGNDDDAKRQAAVDTFQAGQADVFVAPIRAAGVGITLTASHDVLMVERTWVTKELEQAEDRAYRIGATQPVLVTYFDAADTIDEEVARVNAAKTKLIDALIDDKQGTGAEFAAAEEVLQSFVGKVGGSVSR